jgi:hypothetical protein
LLYDFHWIEKVVENLGLAKVIDETESDERLAGDAAKEYYESLKAGEWESAAKLINGRWLEIMGFGPTPLPILHGLS